MKGGNLVYLHDTAGGCIVLVGLIKILLNTSAPVTPIAAIASRSVPSSPFRSYLVSQTGRARVRHDFQNRRCPATYDALLLNTSP